MKKQICNDYNINPENVGIWGSGVSSAFLTHKAGDSATRKIFGDKDLIIMYHGVLSPNRGLQETVRAVRILKDDGLDIGFLILGNGKATHQLECLIRYLNLEKNVVLRSPVPYEHVPGYIAGCDMGVLPFPNINWWRVSSPLKLLEYLAVGKPVLVTELEAHRDVLGHSSCGIFIKSSCPDEIANGIEKAFRVKDRLPEMGQSGKKICSQFYTWQKQAQKLISFLETRLSATAENFCSCGRQS
jgi:glycosyltransferase involved in cell wall biosynthesis